ncbi:hypothetical protein [Pigmentiphaga kullae]|nr:hypothetical protein [Pigmentiphaga kullae]
MRIKSVEIKPLLVPRVESFGVRTGAYDSVPNEFKQRLLSQGAESMMVNGSEAKRFIDEEVTRWADVIKTTGVKLQ